MKKQSVLSYYSASANLGSVISLKGPVVDIRRFTTKTGSYFVMLNIGAKYPNVRRLDVCVWESVDKQYPNMLSEIKIGDEVIVTGEVILYGGVPEIVIDNSKSLCLFQEK